MRNDGRADTNICEIGKRKRPASPGAKDRWVYQPTDNSQCRGLIRSFHEATGGFA